MLAEFVDISKMHVTPALRIAVETGIAELLRESEPEVGHL